MDAIILIDWRDDRVPMADETIRRIVQWIDFVALLDRIMRRHGVEIPQYSRYFSASHERFREAVARYLAVASQALIDGTTVEVSDFEALWESARNRFEEGIGLDEVLSVRRAQSR